MCPKVTNIDLNLVDKYSKNLSRTFHYKKFAELEAINSTPWWGGNYATQTHSPETHEVASFPTTETLKGVLRWIIRASAGGYFDKYSDIENILSRYLGGETRHGDKVEHYESKIVIEIETSKLDKYVPKVLRRVLDEVHRVAGNRLIDALEYLGWLSYGLSDNYMTNIARALKLGDIQNRLRQLYDRYRSSREIVFLFKLFTIPRIRLSLMKKGLDLDHVFSMLPVLPESLKINVRLYADTSHDKSDILAKVSLLALIYALEVYGIGRGSSRGFGRFRIIEESVKIDTTSGIVSKEFEEKVKSIIRKLHSSSEIDVESAINELHVRLSKLVSDLVKGEIHHSRSSENVALPRLDKCLVKVLPSPKHPVTAPIRMLHIAQLSRRPVRDVIEALSAIGYATLKTVWKKAARFNVSAVGAAFHTWILGLPRWQKDKTGYCSKEALNVSPRFVKCTGLCLDEKQIKSDSMLRRKSSFVLCPMVNSGKMMVVVVVYRTYDDHLTRINSDDILHVGRHGKPGQVHGRQVVSLRQVITCNTISPNGAKPGCGQVSPAGIVNPSGQVTVHTHNVIGRDVVDVIYNVALEFITRLLL